MVLLLETKISTRIRDVAERLTRLRWLRSFLYWLGLVLVTAALTFPLTLYEDFFREHKYGLSNQNFASRFRDQPSWQPVWTPSSWGTSSSGSATCSILTSPASIRR